ncbi:MAG: histidine--tRNA ligase [Thermoanaerobaculia bacterium]|nr:histidine--tRNA ligase [Thermoanaerobaculia bacterium]
MRSVKGTRDLLPPETAVWQWVEATARRVFAGYGYGEVRTPALEPTELFVRGVGEATDIVGKQMYTFADRKGRSLTLRPEGTAPVARAVVQHGLAHGPLPLKLFYIGSHFRYERPQKGRYREFHQIGAELIGDPGPHSDAEVIAMLVRFLDELGFSDLVVLLNTVGDERSRAGFREALVEYLAPRRAELSAESRRRLEDNPLRILDTKSRRERRLLEGAPRLDDHLTQESRVHFDELRGLLDRLGVAYRREPRLVRGLDYYTRTVFEIVSEGLGAQDPLDGRGRKVGLVEERGGEDLPGIGFAIGEDRLVEVLPEASRERALPPAPDVVIPAGEVGAGGALVLAEELRRAGAGVVAELGGRSLRAALKQASRSGARHALLLGDEELAAGVVTVKDLETGEQRQIAREEVARWLTAGG